MAIPLEEKRTFETFGDEEHSKSQFQIKQSREAFKILSSGLYANKIKAVIREYSANAVDAHSMSGIETPIQVHLPNTFEPWFSVRDNGIGLSHDEVLELFTTYFSSNKRATNEATGMLGLGSKSGFSYTDQFTVTARKDGTKRVYTCYITDAGFPEVSLVNSESCHTSDTGVEVHMAVDAKDFTAFRDEAKKVYRFYTLRPTITGATISYEGDKKTLDSFKLNVKGVVVEVDQLETGSGYYRSTGTTQIIQGSCAYPVDDSDITNDCKVFNHNFLCRIPIGTVSVTASREGLEYDKPTIAFLNTLSEELVSHLAKSAQDKMKNITTTWDAILLVDTDISQTPIWEYIKHIITFDGKTFDDLYRAIIPLKMFDVVQPSDPLLPSFDKAYASIECTGEYDLKHRTTFKMNVPGRHTGLCNVKPNAGMVVVVMTEHVRNYKQLLKYHFHGNCKTWNGKEVTSLYLISPKDGQVKKTLKYVRNTLRGCTIIKLSDLPEIPKTHSSKTVSKASILSLTTHRWNSWEEVSVDLALGGVYVEIANRKPVNYESVADLVAHVKNLKSLNILDDKVVVYGIPKSRSNIPTKHGGWVKLSDKVTKELNKKMKGYNPLPDYKLELIQAKIKNLKNRSRFVEYEFFKHECPEINTYITKVDNLMTKTVDKRLEIAKLQYHNEIALGKKPTYNLNGDEPKLCSTLEERLQYFTEKYPLVHNSFHVSRTYEHSMFIEYVKAIQLLKEKEKEENDN